ncbi:MAG TPA: polysaccharide deacetylase family protein [Bacteroidota bacterium]|nr:polysaccharide deacetylase family protein [Bacteroidota bacterium]
MFIRVGVVGNDTGWQILLRQEGIPYSQVKNQKFSDDFSVIVVGDDVDPASITVIKEYLRAGGAVLCSGKVYSQLSGVKCQKRYVKYLTETPNQHFSGTGLIDLGLMCDIPIGANTLKTDRDEFAMYQGKWENGEIIVFPFDVTRIITDDRQSTKTFYINHKRMPFERVSHISRAGIRKLVHRSLELLHHRRGVPYIHQWYFPKDLRSICSFRIDTDYGTESEIKDLFNLVQKYKIFPTWFLDVKNQESHISLFGQMKEHEIGLHCYEHVAYGDHERNKQNIEKGLSVLERHGLRAKGYAAPYGSWNDEIAHAIEERGFEYSSEFSYDYDNLPSYPVLNGKELKTLQLPIHPISIGSLRRLGLKENDIITYFCDVIERKLDEQEPLVFYHHPKDNQLHALEKVFDFISQHHIQSFRMMDYASWWKTRDDVGPSIELKDLRLNITAKALHDDCWFHLSKNDGIESFVPMRPTIDLRTVHWVKYSNRRYLPEDYDRIRRFNPWIPMIRLQDRIFNFYKSHFSTL